MPHTTTRRSQTGTRRLHLPKSALSHLRAQYKDLRTRWCPEVRFEEDWEFFAEYVSHHVLECGWNLPQYEEGKLIYSMNIW